VSAQDGNATRRARTARLLAAACPGLGHLYAGHRVRGALLLSAFLALVAVALGNADGIAREWREANVDGWLALATLAGSIAAAYALSIGDIWAWGARPLRREGVSQWRLAWREFKKNRLALVGLGLLLVLYAVTLLTPLLAPYEPTIGDDIVRTRFLPPSFEHWMGTDRFGRDVFTRVLYGARISLSIGFIAVGIAVTLGTLIGAIAGYFGRVVDAVLMRFVDIVISFPRLILVITVIALFKPSIFLVIAVLGLTLWPSTARLVRGEVLSLREREFVQAAQALGIPSARIIARHIVPNTLGPVIVAATLGIGNTILLEAALSFLGLGVQPPSASWGLMVADGRDHLIEAWWIATFPGLAIVLTVVAFNLVGDGLRDSLDPRLRG
jgi:peptide/nickel transport system permease protein